MSVAEPIGVVPAAESAVNLRSAHKWPLSCRSVGLVALIADILIILLCGAACDFLYSFVEGISDEILHYFAFAVVVAVLFVSLMRSRDFYSPTELLALKNQILGVAAGWASVFLFLAGTAFAFKVSEHFSRVSIFSFAVVGFVLLVVERIVCRSIVSRGLSNRRFSGRSAILVTDAHEADIDGLVHTLLKHGVQLDREFVLPPDRCDPHELKTFICNLVGTLRGSQIEEVIVGVDVQRWTDLNTLLSGLRVLPLPISLMPTGLASDILSHPNHSMGDSICIELHRGPLGASERAAKRCIDILAAAAGLILLLPLLTITALMIRLDSPGPILFRQRRLGFNGRPFHILKFRTMSVLEDGPAVCQAAKFDGRVTRLGRWLRRTSIDELPQLLNVLSGSMSLIGPRPHAVAHDNHFDKVVRNYAFRQHVKPGLTGWAQVNGQRGPTPTEADIRRRVEFDLWYIDNWSLQLDLLIIVRTVVEIMRARNAY